ncbi:MAG: tetratricopeptide repeat protein [Acidiferrobacterales bacterium]|nr:tetratricopeptide repeat protein [Acidiferrobacterales bacterium]
MIYMILLLILTAIVSVVTLSTLGEPGYVFLQWSEWQIETSLIFAVAAIFLFIVVLYLVFDVVSAILGIPRRIGRSYREYKDAKRLIRTGQGLKFLLLGDWDRAEKLLSSMARHLPEPEFNYLAAAFAAEKRGDSKKRQEYLEKAKGSNSDHKHVVELVNCQFQIASGEHEEAIEALKRLCSHLPNYPVAFAMLAEAYQKTGDWTALAQLRPHLQKSKALTPDELKLLDSRVLNNRLRSAQTASELFKVWKGISSREQNMVEFSGLYVRRLLEFDRHQEAEQVIRRLLARNWHSELAYLYGLIGGNLSDSELYETAGKWLAEHPEDPELLLTVGKLAIRNELPDKAVEHLRASADNGGRTEATEALGKLLLAQRRIDEAVDAYRKALSGSAD